MVGFDEYERTGSWSDNFCSSFRMDFPNHRYYKLTVLSLCIVGLWPYKTTRLKPIQNLVVFTILVFGFVTQLIPIFSKTFSITTIIMNAYSIVICMVFILKYIIFYLEYVNLRKLIKEMWHHWNILQDEKEIEILKQSAETGRRYVLFFILQCYLCCSAGILISSFIPSTVNVARPVNVSYTCQIPLLIEIFIDQQRYCFLIILCIFVLTILGITIILSTELFFLVLILHILGLYNIASYRIRDGMNKSLLQMSFSEKYVTIYKGIANSMETYRIIIQCIKRLKHIFMLHYFFLMLLTIVFFSTSMFHIYNSIFVYVDNYDEFILNAVCLVESSIMLFFANYLMQLLIDEHAKFFDTPYNTDWYNEPLVVQKLLLFIMQGRVKSVSINIYSLFTPSMEGFCTLIKISCSYFMAFHSIQQQ